MSKLTEIKEVLSKITQGIWWHYQTNNSVVVDPKDPIFIRKTVADCGNFDNAKFIANAPEYITYLLSLLEEKDKALQEIWQTEDFIIGSTADSMRRRAYAALTSSNNEGETI
ncbi:hypothetical protein BK125_04665 [Paenibacillus odorifer]|uniref:Uncharacterized protein n=1 Tax=Paenibacillus odorifer TaxID=189426 RepID=A0ABX3GP52_9BACL|nr:hypothetical protein [Paenibacillus odorifer]OMC79576.1 hypothetical protein BK125_04665 [Paenibacillus odorifer]OMD30782.1 hypothetical protein BSO21_17905 [Paenibacillus odorifer]